MADCRVIDSLPEAELLRLRGLYIAAGWLKADGEWGFLREILQKSAVAVGAFEDGVLVGFGRALSDNCSDGYIQDVVVDASCRRRGIGAQIIRCLEDELRRRGVDWIGLVGEPGTESFYSGLGLEKKSGFTLWKFPGAR